MRAVQARPSPPTEVPMRDASVVLLSRREEGAVVGIATHLRLDECFSTGAQPPT